MTMRSSNRPTIVLAGSLAQKPDQAGHAWVFLQYLLGFRRLGFDVLFLDRLEPGMCTDAGGQPCDVEASVQYRYLQNVMTSFGLADDFAVLYRHGERVLNRSRADVLQRIAAAEVLINVMGYLNDEGMLAAARQRVFLDIDPGFGQMWQDLGLHETFKGHDRYVTVGENIGRADCTIPTCGIDWITTRQPIVLDQWPADLAGGGDRFTSIGAWRGPYSPLEYRGQTYGLRCHEFRKFLALPAMTGQTFELAMDIDPAETNDLNLLHSNGWQLTDPRTIAATPADYQAYLRRSRGEFLVAKNMYVRSRSGWFSDRSICYLASGRPVIAQDTGLRDLYPHGQGLLLFSTPDEAASAIAEVNANYDAHCRAARRLVETHFDSDVVLRMLLGRLSVGV